MTGALSSPCPVRSAKPALPWSEPGTRGRGGGRAGPGGSGSFAFARVRSSKSRVRSPFLGFVSPELMRRMQHHRCLWCIGCIIPGKLLHPAHQPEGACCIGCINPRPDVARDATTRADRAPGRPPAGGDGLRP